MLQTTQLSRLDNMTGDKTLPLDQHEFRV